MKDYNGDVYSVPNTSLEETIGEVELPTKRLEIGPKGRPFFVIETKIELTRKMYWDMLTRPDHFEEDITKTLTLVSGVSEVQKQVIERDLEIEAGASGFGLSASVKASLKITNEMTREWHKEQTEQREQTFKAGYTYCTWVLNDELSLEKQTRGIQRFGNKEKLIPPKKGHRNPETTTNIVTCRLATYQDKWRDTASAEILNRVLKLQAAQGKHKITAIPRSAVNLVDLLRQLDRFVIPAKTKRELIMACSLHRTR